VVPFRIEAGVPAGLEYEAAELLREAFAEKVSHELRPRDDAQAVRVIRESMDPARALVALDDRGVAGLAALGRAGAPFMRLRFAVLAREFGYAGALWRKAYSLMETLAEPRARHVARLEALAVRADLRGRGVGSAMIRAVIEHAAGEGMRELALEVVDTNGRARSLYQRHGFVVVRTIRSGVLTAGGGYRAICFMRRALP
jgi:ribosomal protein S18 acetylase RimI-like enzyme